MNKSGHSINSLYLSGGQAKNAKLMQLLADTLNMDVVLPQSGGDAVTLGSAMLGRFAYVLTEEQKAGGPVRKREELGDGLWKIMVSCTASGDLGVVLNECSYLSGRNDAAWNADPSSGEAEGEEVAGC